MGLMYEGFGFTVDDMEFSLVLDFMWTCEKLGLGKKTYPTSDKDVMRAIHGDD